MSTFKYPETWPQAIRTAPNMVQSRVTEQQKHDLYNRIVSTRDLAKLLGVHETYLSGMFPGKVPLADRKVLLETRKSFKLSVAKDVLLGKYNIREASELAYTSYNTMHRCLAVAKEMYPELVEGYAAIVRTQRQETAASARQARSSYAKASTV